MPVTLLEGGGGRAGRRPRVARFALSLGLTLSLGIAFVPLGCGSSDASVSPVLPGSGTTAAVPERTAKELARCLRYHSAPFPPADNDTYPIDFAVKVSTSGEIAAVDVTRSALPGHDVEACLGGALLEMTLPMRPIAMELRYRAPEGRGAPPSRALFASPAVALAPVSLVPVVLAGLGIIVVVTVIVYVVTDSGPSTTTVTPPVVTAAPVASAAPTATTAPIATAQPVATYVPMIPKTDHEEESPCANVA